LPTGTPTGPRTSWAAAGPLLCGRTILPGFLLLSGFPRLFPPTRHENPDIKPVFPMPRQPEPPGAPASTPACPGLGGRLVLVRPPQEQAEHDQRQAHDRRRQEPVAEALHLGFHGRGPA